MSTRRDGNYADSTIGVVDPPTDRPHDAERRLFLTSAHNRQSRVLNRQRSARIGRLVAAERDPGGVQVGRPWPVEEHKVSLITNREIPLVLLVIHDT
jgi:hypothetical protein